MTVYSFKDISGVFNHPLMGVPLVFHGQVGIKSVTVAMATEKTARDVGADGSVMVSAIPGDDGVVTIVCQQNSLTQLWLLGWYNLVKIAMDQGDITNFATGAMTLRSLTMGYGHIIIGVSIPKLGDRPYAAQGADISWPLSAADIQNI